MVQRARGNARGISATARIRADAKDLYAIIADYRVGHPSILPRPPFVSLDVEQGGRGAGTTVRVTMRVLGRNQTFRAVVTEPEPGRRLVETNDTGYVTTFTVEPDADGVHTSVTISTDNGKLGIAAAVERWFVGRLLRPVFERELDLLADVATRASGVTSAPSSDDPSASATRAP